MDKEIWKDIKGFEGIYLVSNQGRIKSPEGKVTFSVMHGKRKWKERILKQTIGKDNCCRVKLYKDKKQTTHLVHRLVAFAFITTIKDKNYINHIDGSRLNNNVSNLEWCDHTENNNHAFDTGLINTGIKITLSKDNQKFHFRSKAKASEYLLISGVKLNKHIEEKTKYKGYKIKVN